MVCKEGDFTLRTLTDDRRNVTKPKVIINLTGYLKNDDLQMGLTRSVIPFVNSREPDG